MPGTERGSRWRAGLRLGLYVLSISLRVFCGFSAPLPEKPGLVNHQCNSLDCPNCHIDLRFPKCNHITFAALPMLSDQPLSRNLCVIALRTLPMAREKRCHCTCLKALP